MGWYQGHRVPDCLVDDHGEVVARWEAGHEECDKCRVEGMCMDIQEAIERGEHPTSIQSAKNAPVRTDRTWSDKSRPAVNKGSVSLGGPRKKYEILPYQGENPLTRLGKNMASEALSAAATEVALFFKVWRFPPGGSSSE